MIEPSKTSSILPIVSDSYPRWLDELFLRFALIYEGRWTHSIQDPRILELKKAEWFDSLKEFDAEIIAETIADIKRMYQEDNDSFPDLLKFYAIAKMKMKVKKDRQEIEARKSHESEAKVLNYKIDTAVVENAKAEIRRICRLKSVNHDESLLR